MPQPRDLNPAQLAVLSWISDGCPPGVMEGYSHRISAVALRSRGLATISGHGPTWRAAITPAGVAYLEAPPAESVETSERRDRRSGSRRSSEPKQGVESRVLVPPDLRGAHPFVIATRDVAVGLKPDDEGRIRIGPRPGVAYMVLDRAHLHRALRLLQGILREAIRRGWGVVPYDRPSYDDHLGVAIEIRGHRYPIEFYETTETIPFTEEEVTAWRTERTWDAASRAGQMPPPQLKSRRTTGRLRLSLPNGYGGGRANWTEGPRGALDPKLPRVFAALEERAEHDDYVAVEAARQAEERRKEAERRAALERLARLEKAREERLFAEAQAWHEADLIRDYISALRNRLPDLAASERERLSTWCAWCENWIAQNDPVANTDQIAGLDEQTEV